MRQLEIHIGYSGGIMFSDSQRIFLLNPFFARVRKAL